MTPRQRSFVAPALAALIAASSGLISSGADIGHAAAPLRDDGCLVHHSGSSDAGGDPAHVVDGSGAEVGLLPPAVGISPDGSLRAYLTSSSETAQVRVSALDGSGDRLLYDLTGSGYRPIQRTNMLWAGDRLAFLLSGNSGVDRSERLVTLDVSTGAFRVIDAAMPVAVNGFDLSADGSKVAYADASGVFRGSHIWVANGDGTGKVEIVHDPKSDSALPPYFPPKSVTHLRFSPDGTQIAFDGRDGISNGVKFGPSHELWVVGSNGAGLREIAGVPVNNRSKTVPVWSPDGTRIAYGWWLPDSSGLAIVDVGSNVTTDIPGTSGLNPNGGTTVRPQWSATAGAIFVSGVLETDNDFNNGSFVVPAAGGTPVQITAVEGTQPETMLGLIPCSAIPASTYTGLTPARILDTRSGLGAPQAKLGAGAALSLLVAGHGGVPAVGVDTVVLNVTATNTTASSYLTVWPTGASRPNASNLNWDAGATVPNAVVVKIGTGGTIDIYNAFGEADVLVDVVGWFKAGPGFTGITPTRLLDTRTGIGAPAGRVGAGGEVPLQIWGDAVPSSATGVMLNTTVAEPSETGYVTVWPSATARPDTSSLNMAAGLTVANLVASRIGTDGQVRLYNAYGEAHLIADASGYFEAGSGFTGITPTRVIDTRQSGLTIGPGGTRQVIVAGFDTGVPTNARSVIINVTAVDPTEAGYLTVFPAGVERPNASNLNFVAGQTVPNLVFAQIGEDGSISIYNDSGRTDIIVDIVGWLA
jgi:hypothetical protein